MNNYTVGLVPVRYYRPYDANFFTVDNRPLVDLNTNIGTVNQGADLLDGTNQFPPLIDQSAVANTVLVDVAGTLATGLILTVKVANNNTGPVSIITNGSSTGPTAAVHMNGAALTGGELVAGSWYLLSFDGTIYNVLAGTAGTVSANAAAASGQAVTRQTLSTDAPANVASLGATSLTVSASSSISGTASSTSTTAPASGTLAVQYQQLEQGVAYSSSVIDWTSVSLGTPLNVGQTASYFVTGQVASVPLHISCGENQVYEISLVEFNASGTSNDIVLLPNNTGYAGQFYVGGFEVSPDNQSDYFTPASTTAAYSIMTAPYFQPANAPYSAGFYFDDISGSTNTPYLRVMRLFTGSSSTAAIGLNVSGGGIYQAANSGLIGMGTNLSTAVWNNTSTAYTSLGTLTIGPNAEWQILVRRIA